MMAIYAQRMYVTEAAIAHTPPLPVQALKFVVAVSVHLAAPVVPPARTALVRLWTHVMSQGLAQALVPIH